MIYGALILSTIRQHAKKENISKKKVNCSLMIGLLLLDLLNVKYKDIHIENYHIKNLFYDRIIRTKLNQL